MGAKIEIFANDSAEGKAFIERVESLACSKCEVTIYNLNVTKEEVEAKGKQYGITVYPAVVMNGKVMEVEKFQKKDVLGEH
ncbi:glutaredoxin [Paenibacillus sp. NPDC057967]|uniref:glutaredoxin n=1 Tax=Paenibacillus sp. NPDC057967 TaxID=3346293 RepID=UPI0036D93A78